MSGLDVVGYLDRLGLDDPGPPSVEALRRLHRAHVERVPFENLEIQLGRPTTVDPLESAERIVKRLRGGYCYHLNGAFSALLLALGYRVTRHLGGVQRSAADAPRVTGAHMAVTVHGLPHETCPGGVWMIDVGLGSALHEPLPLQEGVHVQAPFRYRIRASDAEPDAWRFDHAPGVAFVGMDFRRRTAQVEEFAPMHTFLSTSPESPFVRVATVQRRYAGGVDMLRGLVLTRLGVGAPSIATTESSKEWFDTVEAVFGLPLGDVDSSERDALWRRLLAAHAGHGAAQAAT